MKWSKSQLLSLTYLTASRKVRLKLERYIHGLNQERDGEIGGGEAYSALSWLYQQVAVQSPAIIDEHHGVNPNGLYQTFIYLNRKTGTLLGTGSFIKDDRGVSKTLPVDGFWGLVSVPHRQRGHGLGTIISRDMDEHCQNWANLLERTADNPLRVGLFTTNPLAEAIYRKLGFKSRGQVFIPEWNAIEPAFVKEYVAVERDDH